MAFQLPKVDHKAIFNQHRRERAIKRKVGLDQSASEGAEMVHDAVRAKPDTSPPVENVAVAEPRIDVPEAPAEPLVTEQKSLPADTEKTTKSRKLTQTLKSESAAKPGEASSPPKPSANADVPEQVAGDTISLKIRLAFPQTGQSQTYDSLAAQIGPQQAVRMIFKRAFDDLRQTLRNDGKLPTATPYAATKDRFVTNKIISRNEWNVAKSSLDPAGIMNPMMFNRTLAERALALFFEKDRQTNAG